MTFSYDYKNVKECEDLIRKSNHPYLMGMIRFLKELRKTDGAQKKQKLTIIGEFGEELRGGIRTNLIARLQKGLDEGKTILPVDVGLDVLIWKAENEVDSENKKKKTGNKATDNGYRFRCNLCEDFRPIEDVEYIRYGQDEAIFHVCKTCKKSLPQDVQQNKLRQLYEIGRELKTAPNQNKSNAN